MTLNHMQPTSDENYFENYLPEDAIARFGKGYVFDMQYAPDGSKFAVASTIGIWIYDTQTWEERNLLTGHTHYITAVKFSPDGKTLASTSCWGDYTVCIWDVSTGESRAILAEHTDDINSIVFSPSSDTLASAGKDQTIRLWNVSTGELKKTLDGHKDEINTLTFNPDGSMLASGGKEEVIRIYDVQTGDPVLTFAAHVNSVDTLKYSPDGKTIISQGADNKAYLWNAYSGELIQTINDNTNTKYSCDIDMSNDGSTIAVANPCGTVRLCNSQTGDVVKTINLETKLGSVLYSPNNNTIACDNDKDGIHLLDTESGKLLHTFKTPDGRSVNSYRYSPDGSTVAISNGLEINFWNIKSGELERTISDYAEAIRNAVFAPDGKTLVSLDDIVRIWDVTTRKLLNTLSEKRSIVSVAYSPDGLTLACGTYNNTILLFQTDTWQHTITLEGHTGSVTTVAFSHDGKTLASGGDNTIRLWDPMTGEQLHKLKGHKDSVHDITFSPNNSTLASGGGDGTIRFWDVVTGKLLNTIETDPNESIDSVTFSSDGSTLTCTGENGDKGIRFRDVSTGELLRTIDVDAGAFSVVYSPDGKTIASGGMGELSIWDVATGEILKTFSGHIDPVYSVAYSPDGCTLASGCRDSTVILWDLTSIHH